MDYKSATPASETETTGWDLSKHTVKPKVKDLNVPTFVTTTMINDIKPTRGVLPSGNEIL